MKNNWIFLWALVCTLSSAQADEIKGEAAWKVLAKPGRIVLFRHALAPGGGDPPGFVLGDCSTQRNLSEEGKTQAQDIGRQLAKYQVMATAIWHSEWCRTRETAQLMAQSLNAKTRLLPQAAFNSFFEDPSKSPAQTRQAIELITAWTRTLQARAGVLMVVTHQVNITALTGVVPSSGEGVLVELVGGQVKVLGSTR